MRPGGERRGNNRDRARRRSWLLRTFDPDLGPERARCHLKLSERCRDVVDVHTLSVDRIEPGGSYAHDNIQPACTPCQTTQGALITREAREQWQQWKDEADAYGYDFA